VSLKIDSIIIVADLNNILTEFYLKSATSTGVEEWMDKHEYAEAAEDGDENVWMAL
jgi:hypothetical protein